MNTAMILAGGDGHRAGADRPKQFVEILGKPVLAYVVDIYQKHSCIDTIEIVCHNNWMDYCREMVKLNDFTKVQWIVPGGNTFQVSVINGLNYLKNRLRSSDQVFIHYGAAPFTSQRIIDDVIRVTEEKGSAVTATPCYQLLGTKDSENESKSWADRDKYIQIACPYGFKYSYLLNIYQRAEAKGILGTAEPHTTSLMYALGEKLNLAYGDQTNIKITTAEDLYLFECYALKQYGEHENGADKGGNF